MLDYSSFFLISNMHYSSILATRPATFEAHNFFHQRAYMPYITAWLSCLYLNYMVRCAKHACIYIKVPHHNIE